MAFDLAETEFNVTKLLDPEDVDVSNPCEKSIITYVSSLFDALPKIPHTYENINNNKSLSEVYNTEGKKGVVQEYSMLYKILHGWLNESINNKLLDSKLVLPPDFVELKSLVADLKSFQLEEYANRKRDLNKLTSLYCELQNYYPKQLMLSMDPKEDIIALQNMWENLDQLISKRETQLEKALLR
jgi:dystonin